MSEQQQAGADLRISNEPSEMFRERAARLQGNEPSQRIASQFTQGRSYQQAEGNFSGEARGTGGIPAEQLSARVILGEQIVREAITAVTVTQTDGRDYAEIAPFNRATFRDLLIQQGAGDDVFSIQENAGNIESAHFDGGAGNNRLNLNTIAGTEVSAGAFHRMHIEALENGAYRMTYQQAIDSPVSSVTFDNYQAIQYDSRIYTPAQLMELEAGTSQNASVPVSRQHSPS